MNLNANCVNEYDFDPLRYTVEQVMQKLKRKLKKQRNWLVITN